MGYIINDLVAPMIEAKKIYYESYYKQALAEKRQIAKQKLQKKYKNREIVLSF